MKSRRSAGWLAAVLLLCVPPVLLGGLARGALGGEPGWGLVQTYLFVLLVAVLAGLAAPRKSEQGVCWPVLTPAAGVLGLALLCVPAARESTALSWLGLGALWFFLLHLALSLDLGRGLRRIAARRIAALGLMLALAVLAGFIPVAVLQWHQRFSSEEAFAAAQVAVLAGVYLLLLLPAAFVARRRPVSIGIPTFPLHRGWWALALTLAAVAVGIRTLQLYQASFYDPAPPPYAGISDETPFRCLPAAPSAQVYDGKAVFARLVASAAANPNKRAPDYGMLALTTGEVDWAQRFGETVLQEAAARKYTGASNSVKYTQYEAALRAYYLPRVAAAFPALFSAQDEQRLQDWFAAINRRALTVEWSDWIYAAGLASRPTGLYENQENGAGLLANLVAGGLADPALLAQDRAYLAANVRGWATRFRNTDDTVNYQAEWINNALFQSLAGAQADAGREAKAFEWLLLQAQPSGRAPGYNFPTRTTLAGAAYLAAGQLRDPRYVWLAGRALDDAEAAGQYVSAQPGIEAAVDLAGAAPDQGSCLLYGDSGLPTRGGPLAPDKIVLRGGWNPGDSYALLNLRFTGWHRYKATNTLAGLTFDGPVLSDQPERAAFAWLPAGRSVLRDKRIEREDLSGPLIPAAGITRVMGMLSGFETRWAQDPPWHAEVLAFGQEGNWDAATTRVDDWHGWQHTRSVYLLRGSSVVVVADRVTGPGGQPPALAWQLEGEDWTSGATGDVARKGAGGGRQRVVLLAGPTLSPTAVSLSASGGRTSLAAAGAATGGSWVTVFLGGDAADAGVRVSSDGGGSRLVIENAGHVEQLSLFGKVQ